MRSRRLIIKPLVDPDTRTQLHDAHVCKTKFLGSRNYSFGLVILCWSLPLLHNLVHNAKLNRLFSVHVVVPLHVLLDLVQSPFLRKMRLVYPVQLVAYPQNLLCMVGNVARLAPIPAAGLVDHDSRMWQDVAVAGLAAGKKKRAHGRGHAHACRAYWTSDVVHRVVYGEPCAHASARRVDVHGDGLLGVLSLEVEQLRDDCGRHGVFDFSV
jgi:hypothetical protein